VESGEFKSIVEVKAFSFAIRIVKLHKYLSDKQTPYALNSQLLRSGTSIGANISEAQDAQSKKDFVSKMSIALKEARESRYWLRLLVETGYLEGMDSNTHSLMKDMEELLKILVSIVKSSRNS